MRLILTRCGLATALLAVASIQASGQTPSHAAKRGVRIIQPDAPAAEAGGGGASVAPPTNAGGAVIAPVTHSVIKTCDRPSPKADVVLGEAKHFDWDLSQALKEGRPVVVNVAEPYDQKGPTPDKLTPWLAAVKDGGGSVTVSPYCMNGRGIARSWLADVMGHLTGSIYKPARAYDVTLYADAGKRKVTQLEFKPKTAAVAAR